MIIAKELFAECFWDRFGGEARAIAALNHPNIGALHDVSANYLLTECVKGSPVAPDPNARKFLDMGIQITAGLTAAHAAVIIHRDLKPDHVLVTAAGTVIRPEQALGMEVLSSGDQFSFGVTLYEMFSGKVPFRGPSQFR